MRRSRFSDEQIIAVLREHDAGAEGMRDDLGAPPRFAEQPLEHVRGSDRSPVRQRELEMRDTGLEVVVEAGHCRRQVGRVGRHDIVAQQARQRRRSRLVAGLRAGLELRPRVLRRLALKVAHLVHQGALAHRAREALLDHPEHPRGSVAHDQ